jgi:hypothetical protein
LVCGELARGFSGLAPVNQPGLDQGLQVGGQDVIIDGDPFGDRGGAIGAFGQLTDDLEPVDVEQGGGEFLEFLRVFVHAIL